jgi:hypothetical protein
MYYKPVKSSLDFMENFDIFENNYKNNKKTEFRQMRYKRNRVKGVALRQILPAILRNQEPTII